MKTLRNTLLPALLVFLSFSNSYSQSATDDDAVRKAVAGFYSALNAMFGGDVEPMAAVWSHADDVSYMGPEGGIIGGWEDVLAQWSEQAAMKLGGEVEPGELHVVIGESLAIVENEENGKNINTGQGTADVNIRATNIFRKEDGEWKMIGHHTDLLPFLAK